MHCPSLRRLQGKTQLFPISESDFYRTRLTHSLEVVQISKLIANSFNKTHPYFQSQNIDIDLVEFAALAHDIGHPPFGHNGEYILDKIMLGHGGFEGNAQTLRILSRIEKKSTDESPATRGFAKEKDIRRGLNVTYRALASILKYDRQIPQTKEGREKSETSSTPLKGYYADEKDVVGSIKTAISAPVPPKIFKTLECSIMDVADDIAYSTYDLEDAFVAGFLTPISILAVDDEIKKTIAIRISQKVAAVFPKLSESEKTISVDDINESLRRVFSEILKLDHSRLTGSWNEQQLASYIGAEVYKAATLLAKSTYHRTKFTSDLIKLFVRNLELVESESDNPIFWQVRPKLEAFVAIESLKGIAFSQLIQTDKFLAEKSRANHVLTRISDALFNTGSELLPVDWRNIYEFYGDNENGKRRVICDFMSGMTNRYCMEYYAKLFGPEPPSIHKPQ